MATTAPIQGEIEEPENSSCEVFQTTGIGVKTPEVEESQSDNILFQTVDSSMKTLEVVSAANANSSVGEIENFEHENFKKSSLEGEAATDVALTEKKFENELTLPRDQFGLPSKTNDPVKDDKAYESIEEKDAVITKDERLLVSEKKNTTKDERTETKEIETANEPVSNGQSLDEFENSSRNDEDAKEVIQTEHFAVDFEEADIKYKDMSALDPKENEKLDSNKDEKPVSKIMHETHNKDLEDHINQALKGQSFDCETGRGNTEIAEIEQLVNNNRQEDAIFSLVDKQDCHADQNLISERSKENSDGPCDGSPDAKIFEEQTFQGNSSQIEEVGTSATEPVMDKAIEKSLLQCEEVNIPSEAATEGNITSKGIDSANSCRVGPQEEDSEKEGFGLSETTNEMEEENEKVVETVVGNIEQISALEKFETENEKDTSVEDTDSQNETLKANGSLAEETENEQLANVSPLTNDNPIALIDSTSPSEPELEASVEEKKHDKESTPARVEERLNESMEINYSLGGTLVVEEKVDDVSAKDDNHSIERSDSEMEGNITETDMSLLEAKGQNDQTNSEKNAGTSGFSKEKGEEKYDFSCATPKVLKEDVNCTTDTKHDTPGDGISNECSDVTLDLREQIKEETEEKGEGTSTITEDQNYKTMETNNDSYGEEEEKDRVIELKKEENNADGEIMGPADYGLDSEDKLDNVYVGKEDSAQSLQNGETANKDKSCESNEIPNESMEDEISMMDDDAKPILHDPTDIGLQTEEKDKEHIGEAVQQQIGTADIPQSERDCKTNTVDAECSTDAEGPTECYHASEINITPAKEINKEFSEMHAQSSDFEKSEQIQGGSEPKEDNVEKTEMQFESASKGSSHGSSYERELSKIDINTPDEKINNAPTLYASKDTGVFSSTETIEHIKGTKGAVENIIISASVEGEESANVGETCEENLQLIDGDTQICDHEYPLESIKKLEYTGTFDKQTDVDTSKVATVEGLTEKNVHIEDASSSEQHYAEMKEACKRPYTEDSIVQVKLQVDEGLTTANTHESVEEQRTEERNNQKNIDMNLVEDEQAEQIFQGVEENHEDTTPKRVTEDLRLMGYITNETTKLDTEKKDQDSGTTSSVTEVDISFSNKEDEESQFASAAMSMVEDNSTKELVDVKHDKYEGEPIKSTERNEVEALTKDFLPVPEDQQTDESKVGTEVGGIVTMRCEETSEQFPIEKDQKFNKPTIETEIEQQDHKISTEEVNYMYNDAKECTSPEDLKVKGDNQSFDKEHIFNPKDWVQQDDMTIDDVILHSGIEDKSFEEGHTTNTREEEESKQIKASEEKTIDTMISTTTKVACCMTEDDEEKLNISQVVREKEASYGTEIASEHIMEERETMRVQNSKASGNESVEEERVEEQYPQTNIDMNPGKDEQAEQIVHEDVEQHDEGITPQRLSEEQSPIDHLADDPTNTEEKDLASSTVNSVIEGDISFSNKEDEESQAATAAMTMREDNSAKQFVDEKHDKDEEEPIKSIEKDEVETLTKDCISVSEEQKTYEREVESEVGGSVTTRCEEISEQFRIDKEQKSNKPTIEMEVEKQNHQENIEDTIYEANDEGECTSSDILKVEGDNQACDKEHIVNPKDCVQQDEITIDDVILHSGVEDKSFEEGHTTITREEGESKEFKAYDATSTKKTIETMISTTTEVACCMTEDDSKASGNESVKEQRAEEQYPQTNVGMNPGKDEQAEEIVHEDAEQHDEGITPQRLSEEQSLTDHLADDPTNTEEKDLASSTVNSVIEGDISFSNKEDDESQAATAAMTMREDNSAKQFVDEKHDKDEEEPIKSIEKDEVETLTKDCLSISEEQKTYEREVESKVGGSVTTRCEEISEQFRIAKKQKSNKPTIEMEVEKQNRQENIEDTVYEANDEGECTSPDVLKVEGDNQACDKEHIVNPKDWVQQDEITIDDVILHSGVEDKSFEEGHTAITREEGESKEFKAYDATSTEKTIETMISTTTVVAYCMTEDDSKASGNESVEEQKAEEQYPHINVGMNAGKGEQAEQIVHEDVEQHDEGITPQRLSEEQSPIDHLADDPTKVDTEEKDLASSTVNSVIEGDISFSNKKDEESQAATAAMTMREDINAKEFVDEKHDKDEEETIKSIEKDEVETHTKDCLSVYEEQKTHEREVEYEVGDIVTTMCEEINKQFRIDKEQKSNKQTIEMEVKKQNRQENVEDTIYEANDEGECTSPNVLKVEGDNQACDKEHIVNPKDWVQQDEITIGDVLLHSGVEDRSFDEGRTTITREEGESKEFKAYDATSREKTIETMISTTTDVACCMTEDDAEKLNIAEVVKETEASYGTEIVSQHVMDERETMQVQNFEASGNESVEEQRAEEQHPQTNVDINPPKRDELDEQIVQEDVEEHDEGIPPERVTENQRLMGHLAYDLTKVDKGEKVQDQDSSTASSVTEGDVSISNKEDEERQAASAAMTMMPDNNAKEFVDEKHDKVEEEPIKYTERNEVETLTKNSLSVSEEQSTHESELSTEALGVVTMQCEAISEYFPVEKEEKLNKPTIELEVKQQTHKTNTEEESFVANDEEECTSPEDVKVKGDNQTLNEGHMDNPNDWVQQQDDTTNDKVKPHVGVEDKSCEAGQTSNIRDGGETNEVKASSSAPTEKTTKTTSADVAYCMTEENPEKLNAQLLSENEVDETRKETENDRHDDMKMEDVASKSSTQDRRYPTREEILDELKVVGIVEKIEEDAVEKELEANDFDTEFSNPEMVDEDKGPDDASAQLDPDKQKFEEAATASTMKSTNQPETQDNVSEAKDENFEGNLTLEAVKKTSLNGNQDDAYMTTGETNITTSLSMVQRPEGEVGETDKHKLVKEQIKEKIELNRETESLQLDLGLDDLIFGGKEFHKDEMDAKQPQEEMANLEVSQIEVPPMGKWKDGETLPEASTVPEEEPNCKDNEDEAIEENKKIDLNGETAESSYYKVDTTTVVTVEAEVTEEDEAARKFDEASNLAPETMYDETTTDEGTISDGSFVADKPMHEHISSVSTRDTTDLGDTSVPLQHEEKINIPSAVLINEPSYKDKEADGIIKDDKEENKVGRKLEEASNLATETQSEESIFADKTNSEYPAEETSISYGLVEVGKPKDDNMFSVSACESTNEGSVECKEKLSEASEVLTEEPNDKENIDEIAGEDKKPDLRLENVIYEVDNEVMTNLTADKMEENIVAGEIEASSPSSETKSAETASTDEKMQSEFTTAVAFVSKSTTADALVLESTTADAFVSEGLAEAGKPKDEQNSSISADETTVMSDITKPENEKFMDASRVFVEEPCGKKEVEIVEQYEGPNLVCGNQASSEKKLKEEDGKLEQHTNEESGENKEKSCPILEMPDNQILLKDDEKLEEISYSKFKESNEAEDKLNSQSTSQTEEEKHEDGNKEQAHSLLLMLEKQGHMERSKMKEAEELTEQASVEEENQVNYLGEKEEGNIQACDHTTEATLEKASSTQSLHQTVHQTVDLEEKNIKQKLEVNEGFEGGNIEKGKNTIKDMEIDAQVLTQDREAVSSDVHPSALMEKTASEASPKREEMEETGAQKDVSESKPAVELDVEEEKAGEEKEHEAEPEHKTEESGTDTPIMVETSREADTKPSPKKSHNLLSGVGSKVKHSISKVKKAITGKSSHPKTPSTSK